MRLQSHACGSVFSYRWRQVVYHSLACAQVYYGYVTVLLVYVQAHSSCCHLYCAVYINRRKRIDCASWRVYQYLGRRCCHRVAHNAALIVAEQSQDVVAIEVDGESMSIGIVHLYCVVVDLRYVLYDETLCRGHRCCLRYKSRTQRQCLCRMRHASKCGYCHRQGDGYRGVERDVFLFVLFHRKNQVILLLSNVYDCF